MTTKAQFVEGSIMRHVIVMTSTSALGLVVIFLVDLVDMYFLSLLGQVELAAAVGYSGSILFFTTSVSIGVAIACGALVSRSIGEKNVEAARRYATNIYVTGGLGSMILAAIIWIYIPEILAMIGAFGRTQELAEDYLKIIIPSMPVLVIAMSSTTTLRALGAAKLAMYATLFGGLVNAVLDPIFIFALDMGIKGAAWASVLSRFTMLAIGLYCSIRHHGMIARFSLKNCLNDLPNIGKITFPVIFTNIATPIGNAYVIASMAQFGDAAVAGMSVIGRLIPVTFAGVFALSGAVGPIVGQNFGAKKYARVTKTLTDSMIFALVYVLIASITLFLLSDTIASIFGLSGFSKSLLIFFCTWIVFSFFFNGAQFVSNAVFNNLGYPQYSTISNFAKATIGTIPFVIIGAKLAGAKGVLAGQAMGSVVFGLITWWYCYKLIHKCSDPNFKIKPKRPLFIRRFPLWPFSSNRN